MSPFKNFSFRPFNLKKENLKKKKKNYFWRPQAIEGVWPEKFNWCHRPLVFLQKS